MAKYAVLSENMVTNIIVGDNEEEVKKVVGDNIVQYTEENPAYIGAIYDSETNSFISPQNEEAVE